MCYKKIAMSAKVSKNRFIFFIIGIAALFFTFLPLSVNAHEILISGFEIANKVFHRKLGRDSRANMMMILRNKKGKERVRTFEALTLDDGATRYSLIRFLSPKDIRGTTFLNISHDDGDSEQYLYLPALRRARRIAGSFKKRRFVNSDYTYEDLERRSPQKDVHKIIGEGIYLDKSCWILESVPKEDSRSQYSKLIQWITKDAYVPVKIDLYNKKGELAKEFIVHQIKLINNIWTVMDATMKDLLKKRETQVRVNQIEYNVGLSKNSFKVKALDQ